MRRVVIALSFTCRLASAAANVKSASAKSPVGLLNGNNICWLNSALQCLSWSPGVRSTVMASSQDTKDPALLSLRRHLDMVSENRNPFRTVFDDEDVIASLLPQQTLGHQNDAQEFFTALVDRVTAADCNLKNLFEVSTDTSLTCLSCNRPRIGQGDAAAAGLSSLSIPVKNGRLYNSLDEALNAHFQVDTCGEVMCLSCSCKTEHTHGSRLTNSPRLLAINLKRFRMQFHYDWKFYFFQMK